MGLSQLIDPLEKLKVTNENSSRESKDFPVQGFKSAGMFCGRPSNGGILVVDDDPDCRKVVRICLEKAGYHVVEAEDGEAAINLINAGENPLVVDVIVTGIRMPRINGVEAIRYFRSQFPRVQIVVVTGSRNIDLAITLLKEGVVDYLYKPFEKEKLLDAVERAMAQREIHFLGI